MAKAFHYQNAFNDALANEFRGILSLPSADIQTDLTRNSPLSEVVEGCVFDLDATLAASYDAGDRWWKNLIEHPADGSAQTAYDFRLGNSDVPVNADPTFVGTPDSPDAYWAHGVNGFSNSFRIVQNTAFIENLTKSQDFTIIAVERLNTNGHSTSFFRTGVVGGNTRGIAFGTASHNGFSINVRNETDQVSYNRAYPAGFGAIQVMAATYNHATKKVQSLYNTTDTLVEADFDMGVSISPMWQPAWIWGVSAASNGDQLYALSMFNRVLSPHEIEQVIAHYTLRHEREYNHTKPLSAVVSGAVFDLEATLKDSYESGQVWKNLIPAPADGSLQSAYDFFRGLNGNASTDDPTFLGSAGHPAAVWSVDGGDFFSSVEDMTAFLKSLHRSDIEQSFTLGYIYRTPNPLASTNIFYTRAGGTTVGLGAMQNAGSGSNQFNTLLIRGDTAAVSNGESGVAAATTYFVIWSLNPAANSMHRWINSKTKHMAIFTKNACVNDPIHAKARILSHASHGAAPNGTQIKSVFMLNEFIDDAQAAKIIDYYELRHRRLYT
jgi:hypothetical protein